MMMAALLFSAANVNAQDYQQDDLLGIWLNEDEDAHIEIYQENELYYGKIIWLKFPIDDETGKAKLDKHNPDEELQKRPSLGIQLLTDFEWDGDNEWDEGDIYDPKTGKTYSCYIINLTWMAKGMHWNNCNYFFPCNFIITSPIFLNCFSD